MSVMSFCSYLRPAAALGFMLLLSACGAGTFDPVGTSTETPSSTPAGTSPSASSGKSGPSSGVQLRLAAGDKIRVVVFGEDKLSGEYQLDTAGAVSLPLA